MLKKIIDIVLLKNLCKYLREHYLLLMFIFIIIIYTPMLYITGSFKFVPHTIFLNKLAACVSFYGLSCLLYNQWETK